MLAKSNLPGKKGSGKKSAKRVQIHTKPRQKRAIRGGRFGLYKEGVLLAFLIIMRILSVDRPSSKVYLL